MAFVLVFIGLIAITVGVRGQAQQAGALLQSEFTGSGSFIQWFLAVMILGLIGYYKPVKPVADGLLGLVILALFLNKRGFFTKLEQEFQNAKPTAAPTPLSAGAQAMQAGAANGAAPTTPGRISFTNPDTGFQSTTNSGWNLGGGLTWPSLAQPLLAGGGGSIATDPYSDTIPVY